MRVATGLTVAFLILVGSAEAQTADNLLVVINTASPASVEVGEYYAKARGVADDHVVRLEMSTDETITYAEYVRTIEAPLGSHIAERSFQDRILYIVLTKGVPIRVRGTSGRQGTVASVDSELTLLYRRLVGTPTSIVGRQDNPYFLGDKDPAEAKPFTRFEHDIYLVTRLDGFTVPDVIALIDRARTPSREGQFVFDQRVNLVDAGGDRWLHQAAERLESGGASGRVILETTRAVATSEGPVLGYYSWGSNDASFRQRETGLTFSPGAIAGMFVSTDGRTFQEPPADWLPGPSRRPPSMFGDGSQSIAADLVREGVTGMSAHVDEPYLDGTPRPQVLFPAYFSGMNLAEAYYLAIPFLSWQNIVIGDPLCAPFREATRPDAEFGHGIDPDTELPALFAERRLAVLSEDGHEPEALKLVLKSSVLESREQDAEAEELLRQAFDLEPRLAIAGLRLAFIYEGRAEYDRAIAVYRRVLEADADNAITMNNLAFALAVRKGELAESLDLAKRAYRQAGLPTIADTVAWIHYLRGEAATAKPLIERAAEAAADNAEIQLHAAFIHAAVGETAKARTALDKALELDPALGEREDVRALQVKIRDDMNLGSGIWDLGSKGVW